MRSCRIVHAPQTLRIGGARALAVRPTARSLAGAIAKASKQKEATDIASVLTREIAFEKEDPTTQAKARHTTCYSAEESGLLH